MTDPTLHGNHDQPARCPLQRLRREGLPAALRRRDRAPDLRGAPGLLGDVAGGAGGKAMTMAAARQEKGA